MPDIELKLKLAGELPKLIEYRLPRCSEDNSWDALPPQEKHFFWLDTYKEVTEREWEWIVWKLYHLHNADLQLFFMADVGWQQRAEAYFRMQQNKS